MEFTLQKADFLKELQHAQAIVERKTTVPILSNLLLETKGNKIVVTATDLDVTIQNSCPAEIRVSGAITVSARKLFDLVRLLPEAPIHFKSAEQERITINCERTRFKIATLSKENFPDIPTGVEFPVTLPAEALGFMIGQCLCAMTQEESRYALNGAQLILNPNSLTLVATDGHRLVHIIHNNPVTGVSGEQRLLVPRKTLVELAKLVDGVSQVEFGHSENHLFFRLDERLLVSRVLVGQFPNFEMVIPRDNDQTLLLNTSEFSGALKRVALMADEESRQVKFSIKEDTMEVWAASSDIGEAHETLPIQYSGSALDISFNAQYILDFLGNLNSEEVAFELKDGDTQGLLKPRNQDSFALSYVVMPMKL